MRVIVLTGNDKAFAAGADLKEMVHFSSVDHLLRRQHLLWRSITQCHKPIIAAINGYALGGGMELAMHCDIIIAGESAQLGQPEIRVGIMPGAGGTQRLTRVAGKFKTMKMVLTGKPVSAREAYDMGIVAEVVPDGEVQDAALKLANTIAGMPPISVSLIKEAVHRGPGRLARDRPDARAPRLRATVLHRGFQGRHQGLHREAQALLQRTLTP